jgi:hypothetical protein
VPTVAAVERLALVETPTASPSSDLPAARGPRSAVSRTEVARRPPTAERHDAPAERRDPASEPVHATAPPPVVMPTRVPPSTELVFALQRGAQSGEARLSWRSDGERYALSLQATMPWGREVEQRSEGGFDAAGIAPVRLADRRRGRDVRAANFQREHGKVTFSGPRWELPLEAGTQDRLSWLVQLVSLVGGASDRLREGTELAMWVVGARGAASHWRFEVRGREAIAFDARTVEALWLVREPAHPYDHRIEVWLSPQSGPWPLRLRQTQIPGGEALEWSLQPATPVQPGI